MLGWRTALSSLSLVFALLLPASGTFESVESVATLTWAPSDASNNRTHGAADFPDESGILEAEDSPEENDDRLGPVALVVHELTPRALTPVQRTSQPHCTTGRPTSISVGLARGPPAAA